MNYVGVFKGFDKRLTGCQKTPTQNFNPSMRNMTVKLHEAIY